MNNVSIAGSHRQRQLLQQYLQQPQPECPQRHPQHFPELFLLITLFTDTGHDKSAAHMRTLMDFSRFVEEMVSTQGETASATSSVLTALVERLAAMPAIQPGPAPAPVLLVLSAYLSSASPNYSKGMGMNFEVKGFLLEIENALEPQRGQSSLFEHLYCPGQPSQLVQVHPQDKTPSASELFRLHQRVLSPF